MADGLHYKPPETDESSDEVSPEFKSAIERAFPDEDWDDERLRAFKEALHICYDEAELAEGSDDDEEAPGSKKGSPALALLFGKPKGK